MYGKAQRRWSVTSDPCLELALAQKALRIGVQQLSGLLSSSQHSFVWLLDCRLFCNMYAESHRHGIRCEFLHPIHFMPTIENFSASAVAQAGFSISGFAVDYHFSF